VMQPIIIFMTMQPAL